MSAQTSVTPPPPIDATCAPLPSPSTPTAKLRALQGWLGRAGRRRYRYRLLEGAALSLIINECCLLWLSRAVNGDSAGHVQLMASTVYFSLWLGIVAGWVLLGGWFDAPTRSLFGDLAMRRGYPQTDCQRLENVAAWRWLAVLLAAPSVVFAAVATVKVTSFSLLLALTSNLLLSVVITQLAAACIMLAVTALARVELRQARWLWVLVCLLPELFRLMLPGLVTVRGLLTAAEHVILRWGSLG